MSKTAASLEKEIRGEFVAQGCKKVGHIELLLSKDKATLSTFFTMVVGKEKRIETRIDVRYRVLNEFAFYISEYGTEYKGKKLQGKFPGNITLANSLHVSGAASLALFDSWETRVFDEGDVADFVKLCIARGSELIDLNADVKKSLADSLKNAPPPDYQIIVELFLERYRDARKTIETQREQDGTFLSLVPTKAEKYLQDIGS